MQGVPLWTVTNDKQYAGLVTEFFECTDQIAMAFPAAQGCYYTDDKNLSIQTQLCARFVFICWLKFIKVNAGTNGCDLFRWEMVAVY